MKSLDHERFMRRAIALADRVAGELIPGLESEGARFAAHDLAVCTDADDLVIDVRPSVDVLPLGCSPAAGSSPPSS